MNFVSLCVKSVEIACILVHNFKLLVLYLSCDLIVLQYLKQRNLRRAYFVLWIRWISFRKSLLRVKRVEVAFIISNCCYVLFFLSSTTCKLNCTVRIWIHFYFWSSVFRRLYITGLEGKKHHSVGSKETSHQNHQQQCTSARRNYYDLHLKSS